ncbi:MAG TPA: glycosyltransferase [Planctomycetaceae bacterium]|nr:glycosyltransferase [Planctomycetaceae bacterium]
MSTATLLPPPLVAPRRSSRRRLLLVAYCFPPVGGAGVQRPVKWVKYLHRHGWDVTVLTPSNPSVPVIDHSLEREIPAETAFIRPKTWEPSYLAKRTLAQGPSAKQRWLGLPKRILSTVAKSVAKRVLQPDPQILWYHNAVKAAAVHLREVPHDAILATAPPYTNFLVGAALKQRFRLPFLVDYRDEWDLSSRYLENAQRDFWSAFVQERMQRHVLRQADAVIATTQASTDHLAHRLQKLQSSATATCIYNGFDDEDFTSRDDKVTLPAKAADVFRLVYTGTLWNLTDVSPVVTAIEHLHEHLPALARRLEFVCVGRKTPEQQAVLSRLTATGCRLQNVDYCDHSTVLAWQRSADALCLLLSDVPGAERVVPAKLFEYLAARKDLLAVLPTGEAAGLIDRCHPAGAIVPSDNHSITRWLVQRLSVGPSATVGQIETIAEFSRERQTERLMELLDHVTSRRQER